jgi:hypothetical protein
VVGSASYSDMTEALLACDAEPLCGGVSYDADTSKYQAFQGGAIESGDDQTMWLCDRRGGSKGERTSLLNEGFDALELKVPVDERGSAEVWTADPPVGYVHIQYRL